MAVRSDPYGRFGCADVLVRPGLEHRLCFPSEYRPMSFDAFTRVLSQADSRGDFLNQDQFAALSALVAEGNKRLDAVNRITAKSSMIITNAARALFAAQPQLLNPGGNAYTSRRNAACLRDLDIILRYITYAIYLGDASVLEDRCLNGLRETYLALGVPGPSVAEAIRLMEQEALALVRDPAGITPGDCSVLISEISQYFQRAAMAVA
jgi:phycocyanin beta chain